jgi:toxin YoeB
VRVYFSEVGWEDFCYWRQADRLVFERLNRLIEDARRSPFAGVGKPEPLRGQFAGFWSRRISGEHRLIYTVSGRAGVDQRIEIAGCRYHYRSK